MCKRGNDTPEDAMKEAIAQAKRIYGVEPDIVLALLPYRIIDLYKDVKTASDTKYGIPTQCFLADKAGIGGRNFNRGLAQYCHNLAMKINAKVGGINTIFLRTESVMPILSQNTPYIIFGADVSHAMPGSSKPSVVTVVGSMDT